MLNAIAGIIGVFCGLILISYVLKFWKEKKSNSSIVFSDYFSTTGNLLKEHPIAITIAVLAIVFQILSHSNFDTLFAYTGIISEPKSILSSMVFSDTWFIYGDVRANSKTYSVPVAVTKTCPYKEIYRDCLQIEGIIFPNDVVKIAYSDTDDGINYEVEDDYSNTYRITLVGPVAKVSNSAMRKLNISDDSSGLTAIQNILMGFLLSAAVIIVFVCGLKYKNRHL